MLRYVKKYRDHVFTLATPLGESVTNVTKGMHFAANRVSRAMDLAHGGVAKHGGFHRVFGGHSIADIKMWSRHGMKFPQELAKDALTPNGVPLPGTETAVNHGVVKASVAQKWGCLNVGDMASDAVGGVDTALNIRKFCKAPGEFHERSSRMIIKGGIKIATAASHGNLPLGLMGACDIGMAAYSKLANSIEIDFSEVGSLSLSAQVEWGL